MAGQNEVVENTAVWGSPVQQMDYCTKNGQQNEFIFSKAVCGGKKVKGLLKTLIPKTCAVFGRWVFILLLMRSQHRIKQVIGVVLLYWAVSWSAIFLNKFIPCSVLSE